MREKIKTETDRNEGRYEQACHKTLRPTRDGARPVKKEESNQGKTPKNNVSSDLLKVIRQQVEVIDQGMAAGVKDCPSPETTEDSGTPENKASQGVRHDGSQ